MPALPGKGREGDQEAVYVRLGSGSSTGAGRGVAHLARAVAHQVEHASASASEGSTGCQSAPVGHVGAHPLPCNARAAAEVLEAEGLRQDAVLNAVRRAAALGLLPSVVHRHSAGALVGMLKSALRSEAVLGVGQGDATRVGYEAGCSPGPFAVEATTAPVAISASKQRKKNRGWDRAAKAQTPALAGAGPGPAPHPTPLEGCVLQPGLAEAGGCATAASAPELAAPGAPHSKKKKRRRKGKAQDAEAAPAAANPVSSPAPDFGPPASELVASVLASAPHKKKKRRRRKAQDAEAAPAAQEPVPSLITDLRLLERYCPSSGPDATAAAAPARKALALPMKDSVSASAPHSKSKRRRRKGKAQAAEAAPALQSPAPSPGADLGPLLQPDTAAAAAQKVLAPPVGEAAPPPVPAGTPQPKKKRRRRGGAQVDAAAAQAATAAAPGPSSNQSPGEPIGVSARTAAAGADGPLPELQAGGAASGAGGTQQRAKRRRRSKHAAAAALQGAAPCPSEHIGVCEGVHAEECAALAEAAGEAPQRKRKRKRKGKGAVKQDLPGMAPAAEASSAAPGEGQAPAGSGSGPASCGAAGPPVQLSPSAERARRRRLLEQAEVFAKSLDADGSTGSMRNRVAAALAELPDAVVRTDFPHR